MDSPEHSERASSSQALRRQAEERIRRHRPNDLSSLGTKDLQVLIHELEVHQVELEVQNEELRRAQVELAEARNRYQDLYEFAPVGYLTLDEQGVIREANQAIAQLTGMERHLLVGQRIEKMLTPEDRDRCYVFLREMATSRAARTAEFRLAGPDGQPRWVGATASPLEGTGERLAGFRVALSNIHERKQAEKSLQESRQQLQELAQTLEQRVVERTIQLQALAAQLSQAEQRERHRLAKILHDHLQQLLVGAKFSLGILRRQVDGDNLLQSVRRVDDLLDESVATSRSLTAELSPPILYQGTMRQVLEWLARWMQEKHGLSVHLEADEQVNPHREEIRVLVFEIVRELLLNIVKHARTTSATVRMTRADGSHVQVDVADAGVGFDPAHAWRKEDAQFGLLSIRERLAVLGGQMDIDSAPGKGTRVTVVVPTDLLIAAEKGMPAADPRAGALPITAGSMPAAVTEGAPQKIRVLLADDHAVVRDGLARLLLVQPGIDVVGRASDGLEAREMALLLHPDVVVMDVSMPGLNGMEATRQILAERPETQVIGLSMHTEPDIAAAMREAGAVAYLAKTSQPDILIATIRQCAGQTADR